MKKQIGSYEAKTKLPSLLKQVSEGSSFTITKRGQPIALLSPVSSEPQETLEDAVEAIKQMRKKYSLGEGQLKKLINEGRK